MANLSDYPPVTATGPFGTCPACKEPIEGHLTVKPEMAQARIPMPSAPASRSDHVGLTMTSKIVGFKVEHECSQLDGHLPDFE